MWSAEKQHFVRVKKLKTNKPTRVLKKIMSLK